MRHAGARMPCAAPPAAWTQPDAGPRDAASARALAAMAAAWRAARLRSARSTELRRRRSSMTAVISAPTKKMVAAYYIQISSITSVPN